MLFGEGGAIDGDLAGTAGVEINYGVAPDVQIAASLPLEFERPRGGQYASGLGNIDLAGKVLVAHQLRSGLNIAVYPHLTLPSPSRFGEDHASFFLPVWLGRSGDDWSVFGGGGCAINRGGASQEYCEAGLAVTRSFDRVTIGAELFHETPAEKDLAASTILGAGLSYDVSERLHVLGYWGAQLENTKENGHGIVYASLLFNLKASPEMNTLSRRL
ncbi:MAG: transporter [Vitreimonas sp.]